MKKYTIIYYLPKQCEILSDPYSYTTSDINDFTRACKVAAEKGYKVVDIIAE